ncbi:hypothetical protein [Saccharothrix deserti]|uniref:hypothetical protein n=1 Tax=Saccharothrix deserti TaxID=2593674 RepID=UPI00131ACB54|nr:hypothetical protein [Saccharothrix deserti]
MKKVRLVAVGFAALLALFSLSGIAQASTALSPATGAVAEVAFAQADTRTATDDATRGKKDCGEWHNKHVKVTCDFDVKPVRVTIKVFIYGKLVKEWTLKKDDRVCVEKHGKKVCVKIDFDRKDKCFKVTINHNGEQVWKKETCWKD